MYFWHPPKNVVYFFLATTQYIMPVLLKESYSNIEGP